MANKRERLFRNRLSLNYTKTLNDKYSNVEDRLSNILNDTNDRNNREIHDANIAIDDIIDRELSATTDITSSDMAAFLVALMNDRERFGLADRRSLEQIFEADESALYEYFTTTYRSKAILYNDLAMIVDKLYELEEAVLTTRDSIITADDLSQTISRQIKFKYSDGNSDEMSYKNTVEKMEDHYKLPQNIKNKIVVNTLIYGNYYAYTIPYRELFKQHLEKRKDDFRFQPNTVLESMDDNSLSIFSYSAKDANDKAIKEASYAAAGNITVCNKDIAIPLMETSDLEELFNHERFDKLRKNAWKQSEMTTAFNSLRAEGNSDKEYADLDNIIGCYVKYIHPKHIIPIKLLDMTLGYYYLYSDEFASANTVVGSANRISSMNANSCITSLNNATAQQSNGIVATIADTIINAFDKPFLKKNEKFKELIMNALLYDDLYKKSVRFQFIPAEYITHFKINEDDNGEGQSILLKSLFYAKLYLALLLFKMLSFISKSNDTRVYYIKNSGIDKDVSRWTQETARHVKRNQINMMDMLNYNAMANKIGANQEMFVPVGRNNDRALEFDILSGQQVDMNTDFMEMLKQAFINATGVPSVLMNYVNEADYSRTLVMANSKYVGRIISYQIDLNPSLTELYKKLMRYSDLGIPENLIDSFVYTLNKPQTLNSNNLTDMMGTAEQITNSIIKALAGESESDEVIDKAKDLTYFKILTEYVPGINWDKMKKLFEASVAEAKGYVSDKESSESNDAY